MMYPVSLKVVYTDEWLKIEVEPSLSLLQLTWLQHPTGEQYRRGYRQAIGIALENKTKYWLTDSRKVAYLHLADQHWMYAKMRPFLTGGQLRKFAIVMHAETWMMTDLKPVFNHSEPDAEPEKWFNLSFFLDRDAALVWLSEEGLKL
jgi:hypothetical protein